MKALSALLVLTTLFSVSAHAVDSACASKARNAVIKAALGERPSQEPSTVASDIRSEAVRNGRLTTVFDIYLDMCEKEDEGACGSMSFEAVTIGDGATCKVVRVTLTGEE